MPAADAAVSAEGVRETLPPLASEAALLQSGMPGGGPSLVTVEGPATLPGDGGGPAEAQRARPTLPGTCPPPSTVRVRSSSAGREGHPYNIFFRARVTGQVVTWALIAVGDRPCNGSARGNAGGLGNASGSESGAGRRRAQDPAARVGVGGPPEVAVRAIGTLGAER